MQSGAFSVPGICGGILVAWVINIILKMLIFHLTNNTTSYGLSSVSLVVGLLCGILLPLVANIVPIKAALGKNLRTSLDLTHRADQSNVGIKVEKMEKYGMSMNQVIVSSMLVFFGFVFYYVVPMSY